VRRLVRLEVANQYACLERFESFFRKKPEKFKIIFRQLLAFLCNKPCSPTN
jgi:hypothetical protein